MSRGSSAAQSIVSLANPRMPTQSDGFSGERLAAYRLPSTARSFLAVQRSSLAAVQKPSTFGPEAAERPDPADPLAQPKPAWQHFCSSFAKGP